MRDFFQNIIARFMIVLLLGMTSSNGFTQDLLEINYYGCVGGRNLYLYRINKQKATFDSLPQNTNTVSLGKSSDFFRINADGSLAVNAPNFTVKIKNCNKDRELTVTNLVAAKTVIRKDKGSILAKSMGQCDLGHIVNKGALKFIGDFGIKKLESVAESIIELEANTILTCDVARILGKLKAQKHKLAIQQDEPNGQNEFGEIDCAYFEGIFGPKVKVPSLLTGKINTKGFSITQTGLDEYHQRELAAFFRHNNPTVNKLIVNGKERPLEGYQTVSVQFNLDGQFSQKIFDKRNELRKQIKAMQGIFQKDGQSFDLAYMGAASYPHVTLEVFKNKKGGDFTRADVERHLRGPLQETAKTSEHFKDYPAEYGFLMFAVDIVMVAKFEGGETKYYKQNEIEKLKEETNALRSFTFVYALSDEYQKTISGIKAHLLNKILGDAVAQETFSPNGPTGNFMHVTLLKLRAVPVGSDYYQSGNRDLLCGISHEAFDRIITLFKGMTHDLPDAEFLCDELVVNPWRVKERQNCSPDNPPIRTRNWHQWGSVELTNAGVKKVESRKQRLKKMIQSAKTWIKHHQFDAGITDAKARLESYQRQLSAYTD